MEVVQASPRATADVADGAPLAAVRAPDRVYVRAEHMGRIRLLLWGMEHEGRRCEVGEASVPGRPPAAWAIERDLRVGLGI
jgi:hypothetical protein